MKAMILSVFCAAFFVINISAQEVTPFQFKDQKGITLNKKSLELLTLKTWTTYKQYYVNKNEGTAYSGSFMAFKFAPDRQFSGTANNQGLTGTWKIDKKHLLNITIQKQADSDPEAKISGTYLIYKLSADELVMVKNLPGDANMRIVYYCKSSKTSVLTESPKIVATAQPVDKKDLEASRLQREQQALMDEIETEAQLRGIKLKEKMSKMDVKTLQSLKKQILSGEYQKINIKG